jgi:hypothetical protein
LASIPFTALNRTCVKAFGSPVTYQPAAGAPFAVNGILQKDTDEERHQDAVYARLFINLSDFTVQPAQGDEVTVDGTIYKVFEVLSDPTRGAWLALRES